MQCEQARPYACSLEEDDLMCTCAACLHTGTNQKFLKPPTLKAKENPASNCSDLKFKQAMIFHRSIHEQQATTCELELVEHANRELQ